MARFRFTDMPDRVRKDPLGPVTLNQLRDNAEAVQALSLVEHDTSGGHTALEVPRVLGNSAWSSPNYTHNNYGESSYYSSASNPAVGQVDVVLEPSGFSEGYMQAVAACCDEDVLNVPWVATVEVVDSENVSVYLQKCTGTLPNAANTWAAADGSFALAVHSLPPSPNVVLSSVTNWQRRDTLTEGVTDWNALVELQGDLRAVALEGHTSTGAHDDWHVAKEYAHLVWNSGGSSYSVGTGNVSSVSRISQGVIEVTTTTTYSSTTDVAVFPQVLTPSTSEVWIVNYRVTATNKVRLYLYQLQPVLLVPGTYQWNRADADVFLSIHGQ